MQYTKEQDKQFRNYVRQFDNLYKVRKGEDGVYEIVCKYGDIEPYSLTELSCYQQFKSRRKLTFFKIKLPTYCIITQEAELEVVFKFPNKYIHEIAKLTNAKCKLQLSDEERNRKSDKMKTLRFKKMNKNTIDRHGFGLDLKSVIPNHTQTKSNIFNKI